MCNDQTCIHHQQCTVSPTLIVLTLPAITANTAYFLQLYVTNPHYVSSAGLEMYERGDDGRTLAIAFADELLTVTPILISPEQINLLWGIPYQQVVGEMGLGLFITDATSSSTGTLSPFDIGFSVGGYSPIEGTYTVRVQVGAATVLEESINHNLPSLNNRTISCTYQLPELVCQGVSAFVRVNYRYYVRAKGYFTTADDLSLFGDVSIVNEVDIMALFTPLSRALTVATLLNADYHDYSGLYNAASQFRVKETMVGSHNDTLMPNSTASSVWDFFRKGNGLVGVDPTISPQQLQFYMQVSLAQMSLPSPTASPQVFTMKVFVNPHIMNSSALGIDHVAYSQDKDVWDILNSPCYVDTSTSATIQNFSCQKYDDHVHGSQFDNIYMENTQYGLYQWTCGDGTKVTCASGDCADACRILRGGFSNSSMNSGDAGVLSIRNVTFLKDYHSPVQANELTFDVVIAFYQAGTLVTASQLNLYTVNQTRLSLVKAEVVNKYSDSTGAYNLGDRIPTLLRIAGRLTLPEAGNTPIASIMAYVPSCLTAANFR